MRKVSHRHLWRHAFLLAAVFTTGVLASAIEARAVILYSTDVRNTSAPSDAEGLTAWNIEGMWGSYLATPIDDTHFVVAQHLYSYGTDPLPTTISFQNHTYNVNTSSRVPDAASDLCIYSIVGDTFPTHATLYDASIDGLEKDKTLTVIGKGTLRGVDVKVGTTLKGWQWGTGSSDKTWGQNIVDGLANYTNPDNTIYTDTLLRFNFDAGGIPNEAILSRGDSSGGVFIYSNGEWKLAGINYDATGTYSYTATGAYPDGTSAYFNGALFDQQGLYYLDARGNWIYDNSSGVDPGYSEASSISARLDWIRENAPGVTVPEPATLMLLISGAMSLAVFGRFARRRKAP